MPGRSRTDRLSMVQLRELWAWQDSGLSFEAALAKVQESQRVLVAESQARHEASQGDAAYQALFGGSADQPPASASLSEGKTAEPAGDPYEALFGRPS